MKDGPPRPSAPLAHVCGLRFVRGRHQSCPREPEGALKSGRGLDEFVQPGFPIVGICCVNWLLFWYDHTEAAFPVFKLVVRWPFRQDPLGVVISSV